MPHRPSNHPSEKHPSNPAGRHSPTNCSSKRKRPSELLSACVGQNDEDAWRELSCRYGRKIRRSLYVAAFEIGIHLSPEEIAELCQDLFVKLLTCERPFRGQSTFEFWAYIHRSTRHLALDFARRKRAAKRRGCRGPVELSVSGIFKSKYRVGVLSARDSDPEQVLLRKEHHQELTERCLSFCRPEHAEAVQLTIFEGCTSAEASQRLRGSLSPKQVDNAVGHFKKALSREGLRFHRRTNFGPCNPLRHMLPPVKRLRARIDESKAT